MTNPTANPPARSVEIVSRQLLDEMNELFTLATDSIIHDEDGWHCRVCGMELDSESGHRDNCLASRVLDSAVMLHELEESLKEESGLQPVIDPLTARDIAETLIAALEDRGTIPRRKWEDLTARDLDELTRLIVKRYSK